MRLDPAGYGLIPVVEVDQHTINNFCCNTESLDTFLKVDAKAFHEGRIGYTYCIFHEHIDGLASYVTMSSGAIKMNDSEVMDLGLNVVTPIREIPSVLIGKFAVRKDLQKNGNGQDIMELAIDLILDTSPASARLVVVDALDIKDVLRFYEKCGFQKSLFAEKQAKHQGGGNTVKMFRDVLASTPYKS